MWLSRSDLRYTLRQMSRKPGFVLLSALVLAGGLAASLMAFTICYAMFYRPLPIENGERIVYVCPFNNGCNTFLADDFARVRGELDGLENVGVYIERGATLSYGAEEWRSAAIETEWNLFQLSNTSALLGRTLQPGDQEADAEDVVVVGYEFWQRRLGGDADIIGKTLDIDRQPVRIIGVMPQGYAMPYSAQLWLPISSSVLAPLGSMKPMPLVWAYALRKPGVNIEQASQEATQLMARNREQFPADPAAEYSTRYERFIRNVATAHVAPFTTATLDSIGRFIVVFVMNSLTFLVFLLACINVGTLLLARINERMKDTSIRVALGAPRGRLLAQLCLESTVITVLGSALALLLAGIGLEVLTLAIRSLNEGLLAFWMDVHVDAATLAGLVLYAVLTITLTSVLPGRRIINGDFNAAMRDGTRGALGIRPGRFSRALVVTALMIVTLLLYLVALVGSTLIPATRMLTDVPASLVMGGFAPDPERYGENERQQLVRNLATRLATEPNIAFANIFVDLGNGSVEAEGTVTAANERVVASFSAQYPLAQGPAAPAFHAPFDDSLGLRLLEGRTFTGADTAGSELVLTVSVTLAESLWPGQSALGKRLRIVGVNGIAEDWRRVVGLTSDSTSSFVTENRAASFVLPLPQIDLPQPQVNVSAFAHNAAGKGRVMQFLRDEFATVDTITEPFAQDPATMLSGVASAFGMGVRLSMLVGVFVFAVAIAGIYGLTQNSVQMATHEIGVRRALGARDSLIARLFMKRTGRQVMKGFIAALFFCAPVTVLFYFMAQEFSFDVPFSLAISLLVIALLYAFVMLATYLPVRRILRMEPSDALRYE